MKRSILALLFATAGLAALTQAALAQTDRKPPPAKPQTAVVAPEFPTEKLVREALDAIEADGYVAERPQSIRIERE